MVLGLKRAPRIVKSEIELMIVDTKKEKRAKEDDIIAAEKIAEARRLRENAHADKIAAEDAAAVAIVAATVVAANVVVADLVICVWLWAVG